jgi:ribosomal protein S18 acetylase RimI-like enzyme
MRRQASIRQPNYVTRAVPWQTVSPRVIEPLYARERERWASRYGWSTDEAWAEIERGRCLGTVPGFVAMPTDGDVQGWTYFIVHRGALQVGGLAADSAETAAQLIDAVLEAAAKRAAESVMVFAPNEAPSVPSILAARGLSVELYDYLCRETAEVALGAQVPPRTSSHHVRSWRTTDAGELPRLLAGAYAAANPARPFASQGSAFEWAEYAAQLVEMRGCGAFRADCSYGVVDGADAESVPAGIVVVTDLGLGTAHIAQVAVDPDRRGRGYGRLLVQAACAGAARAGFRRISLFVGERNEAARHLYGALGFAHAGSFTAAGSFSPPSPGRS